MEKYSVKKPFTVLVAVIMIILLGVVAISNMETNLLPDVSTNYLMVVTVYPGASPERVESEVSSVLENALTVSGVESITATNAENYSLLRMKFAEGTDMDSALVQVSNKIDQTTDNLPSSCLTPSIIQYSLNMNAFMTAAVSMDGADMYETSDFVSDTLIPELQRQSGVASVSSAGLVSKMVQVQLSQTKIDAINERLLEAINTQLADAKAQLDSAEEQIAAGQAEYEKQLENYGNTVSDTLTAQMSTQVAAAVETLRAQAQKLLENVNSLIAIVQEPEIQQALIEVRDGLNDVVERFNQTGMRDIDSLIEIVSDLRNITDTLTTALEQLQARLNERQGTEGTTAEELAADLQVQQSLETIYTTLNETIAAMDDVPTMLSEFSGYIGSYSQQSLDAYMQFLDAREMLQDYQSQLNEATQQYEDAKAKALESSDVAQMLDVDTLATLIYAQNFSMPAGYVQDKSNKSWLLKVGEEYTSVDDVSGALLLHVDGFGDVRLSDVADVEIIDDSESTYTRLNGQQSVVLKIYKTTNSSAGEVSGNCTSVFEDMEAKYEGVHVAVVSNQGNYITLIINSITSSMAIGAALAIFVLAVFLRDFKPTLVVGISIPLSVLFAVVMMYFTGLDLNVMTLAGLSLGIGMLVDNSIVVIENIYRLRGRGVPAARAAVQGTRQVAMSIMASTLTSVCVFLPVVFSKDLVKNLMLPMSLCIGYCLMASMIVAVSVVPAAASTVLKKSKPKELKWFDKILEKYGRSLEWCLDHKVVPLAVCGALLALCCWRVFSMGIQLLPVMTSNEATISMTTADGLTKEESYAVAEQVAGELSEIENVEDVAVSTDKTIMGFDINQLGLSSTVTSLLNSANSYGKYAISVMIKESATSTEIETARLAMVEVLDAAEDCSGTVSVDGMDELTSQLDTGLSVRVFGPDSDTIIALADKVIDIVNGTEGFANATTGLGEGDATVELKVDRDKVRSYGLTVAQVYQEVAAKLTNTATAQTPVTVDGTTMSVTISSDIDPVTKENMMDITFDTSVMQSDGSYVEGTCTLADIATWTEGTSPDAITTRDQNQYVTVTADTLDGYNTTTQSRVLQQALDDFAAGSEMPDGCSFSLSGESDNVNYMTEEMTQWLGLALPFVYLVMVAQFQSLLSPFIVLFTVPMGFTGGLLALLASGKQLDMISLMGFVVLMGTVVNNGIVFVDYANQLRLGGLDRRTALVATGKTRMRPILMTTLTTVLAMVQMVLSDDIASQLVSGMALVIIGGLTYATLMTLYIVPILYDLLFKRQPLQIDVGSDSDLSDIPDDAAEYLARQQELKTVAEPAPAPQE